MCHLYGCLLYKVKETTALIMVLNVSFTIWIIPLSWGLILITLRWFKSHWQFLSRQRNHKAKHMSVSIHVIPSERKAFLNSGTLHVFRAGREQLLALQQTTTQHPNDSIIRSIIAVIILFISGQAYKEGLVKNEGWGWDQSPPLAVCFRLSNLSFSNEEKESENSGKKEMSRLRSPAPLAGSNSRG